MNSQRNHHYINIDDVATELGAGFSRGMVLKLATEGDFSILYIPTGHFDNKTTLITPFTLDHTKINKLINGEDLTSPYTDHNKDITFDKLYVTRERVDVFKREKQFERENINKREPIFFNESEFQLHRHCVPELQYAIKIWRAIYLQPDKNVYACDNNRKDHAKLIKDQIKNNPFKGNTNNSTSDLIQIINPIPFGDSPDINIAPLSENHFTHSRNSSRESPLYVDHDLAAMYSYYPIELHLAIEAWEHIFAYAPSDYKQGFITDIICWLASNFKGLNDRTYNRIASLANPDKRKKDPT